MDTVVNVVGYVSLGVTASLAALGGIHKALELLAPKTKTDLDDKALAGVSKAERALTWVSDKLLALLGAVTKTKVERK